MTPLLFTSIPPCVRGEALERTTASSPQLVTIRSWIGAGFQPVSINLRQEIQRFPDLPATLEHFGVQTLVVEPRWPVVPEAPLCPFLDFLDAIARRSQGNCLAILNADIRLAPSPDRSLAGRVSGLGDDEYLVAQRSDLSSWDDGRRRRMIHAYGFDFVAFRSPWIGRISRSLTPDLGFGLPWWDHYLPLALAALGAQTRLVDPRWFEHDVHAFQWNWDHYCRIGRTAARQFQETLEAREALPDSLPARAWLDAIEMESVHPAVPGRFRQPLRQLAMTAGVPNLLAKSVLGRVAAANVRIILQSATSGPLPVLQGLG